MESGLGNRYLGRAGRIFQMTGESAARSTRFTPRDGARFEAPTDCDPIRRGDRQRGPPLARNAAASGGTLVIR